MPSEEIRIVLNLYWSQTAQIRGRSEDSRSFKIEKGVRQGCALSAVCFNMYSEELINEALQDETGLVVNGVVINNMRFADDTVLLANTEDFHYSTKKREHSFSILKAFFVRHSSEYETSDSDQKVN